MDGVGKESHPLVAREPNQVGKSSDAGTKSFSIHQKIEEAPSWAIQYGQEFWHRSRVAAPPAARQANLPSNINLGDIISRVSHAFRQDGPSDLPQAKSSTYVATVDGEGFRLSPKLYAGQREVPGLERGDPALDSAAVNIPVFTEDPSTEVRFRTESVRFGSDVLYTCGSEPVPWSVVGNTAQGLLNPQGLIEHYECGDKGVEVSWVLRNRPVGNGPLEIAAQLTGLVYDGQDQAGHHFADSSSNRRVTVGDVEIVDAAGSRYEVPLLVENTQLKVQVSAEILEHATFPIAIDPVIGPKFDLTAVMASHAQYEPAVASNGDRYCVVWSDLRLGTEDIWVVLVENQGYSMFPSGARLITNPLPSVDQLTPEIASDGTDFLVVWMDGRNLSTTKIDIYGARIMANGTFPDGTGFPISMAIEDQYRPRVAGNANGYFVVWQERIPNDVFGARVTSSGAVLDPNGINIFNDDPAVPEVAFDPQVATDGANFLVAFTTLAFGATEVVACNVTSGGVALNPDGIPIQFLAESPTIAYASTVSKYLISYLELNASSTYEIRGKQVADLATGGSIGNEFTINSTHEPSPMFPIESASNGTDYLVAWTGDSGVDTFGARVRASDGVVLDPAGFTINAALADDQVEVAVASNGTDYLAVWLHGTSAVNAAEQNDIFGARVRDLDGRTLDYIPISRALANLPFHDTPAVGSDGANFLIAWSDNRIAGFDIFGTRVSPSSLVMDPSGIAISTAGGDQLAPDVTWNGVNYLVAWTDYRNGSSSDIYGARVSSSGILQDSSGIPISTASGGGI